MALNYKPAIDGLDVQILQVLQQNARISLSELGRQIKLSQPAVAERVRRLEEADIIRGYHADIDPGKIGLPITAYIRITTAGPQYRTMVAVLEDVPEVVECHTLTGDDCVILKVLVASISQLEGIINQLWPYGTTSTSIVLSSPLKRHTLIGSETLSSSSGEPK